ncbi:MAG: ribonuclease HI [Firmicutes bacterium]|nr:ribonuclease HI [Bacillota bacterium]
MKKIQIYTDGACSGNPGVGGWAAILLYGDNKKELSGYDRQTTNNRMEMFSIIKGLDALKEPCLVEVYSDSAYCVDAFNKGWIDKWKKNGWKTANGDPVKNDDLWRDLCLKVAAHQVVFIKVKGHADNFYNNECDRLARLAIKNC